jgi:UDP:flavonoid glycosyltransferase YjiC (YdhE family)
LHTHKQNTKVLVAPLDWGLGHATRCIPIIKALLSHGYEVLLAGEGAQATLLQAEFPQLTLLPLKGYRVTYSTHKRGMALKLLWQLPKIWRAIRFENRWLHEQVDLHHFTIIISDNRYGLHHPSAKSIFITHQLTIKAPFRVAEKWLQQIQYRLIRSFNTCWVPDIAGLNNAAGVLSHPAVLPQIPVEYIGWLSRFEPKKLPSTYRYCIVLSGPEPQRTLLENKLLHQLTGVTDSILFIRGLPGAATLPTTSPNIVCKNHLPQEALEMALLQSEWIISRTGYTTVMEILCLQKKAILIPTPGQTEQEYLAERLGLQNWAYAVFQETFEWKKATREATDFDYQWPANNNFQAAHLPALIHKLMNE